MALPDAEIRDTGLTVKLMRIVQPTCNRLTLTAMLEDCCAIVDGLLHYSLGIAARLLADASSVVCLRMMPCGDLT